jgi:peptide/nickel transport system substrate-binding protein
MRRLSTAGSAALLTALVMCGSGMGSLAAFHARAASSDSSTFIVGDTEEPDTLNPLITQLEVGSDVDSAVFDSLIKYDTSNNPYPVLATSYSYSRDGRTWTFHLRHGVKWADGVPFTSADVAYTYSAILNKKNNIFSTQGWDKIDKFSTPDDYTVTMHIKQAFAPFLVDIGATFILPKHILDKPGVDFNKGPYSRTPMGTGPYMVKEWKTADHITLIPNPYSWRGQPHFKQIIFKIVPNNNTELVQLQTGDLDMARVDASQVEQAKKISGKRLKSYDANAWYHIDLKQWGFIREKAVRQALDYATPKEAIIKGILHGYGTPAYADIDPNFKAYYNPNLPTHPYSLAKAAQLLASDGFTKGPGGILQKGGKPFNLTLWTISSDDIGQKIDTILKNLWARLGINVTLSSQGVNTIFGANGPQFTKDMTGINYSWFNGNDPSETYYWNSSQIPSSPTGAGGNDVGYYYRFDFQKQIDQLTNAADAAVDPAKRRQLLFQTQALLADEVPVIFLYWSDRFAVIPDNLTGYTPNPFGYLFWDVVNWQRG